MPRADFGAVQKQQLVEIVPHPQVQAHVSRRLVGFDDKARQQPARAVRDGDRVRQTQIVFGDDVWQAGKIERQGSDPS